MKSVVYKLTSFLVLLTLMLNSSTLLAQSQDDSDPFLPVADVNVFVPQSDQIQETAPLPAQSPVESIVIQETRDAVPAIEGQDSVVDEPISCKVFSEMTGEKRMEHIILLDTVQNEKFCSLAENSSCLDYENSLQGFGVLRPAASPSYCKFAPLGQ